MAVIGGLVRIEGAWVGAFVFILMQNYITSSTHIPLLGFGGTLFGGSFNTIIGIIFLAIVVVSPDGLHGSLGTDLRDEAAIERRRAAPAPAAGAREMTSRSTDSLESWVVTARESRAPSKHEREEGTTR